MIRLFFLLKNLHSNVFLHPLQAEHNFFVTLRPILSLFLNHLLEFEDFFAETVDHKTNSLLLCYFISIHSRLQVDYFRADILLSFFPSTFEVISQDCHGLCLDGFILFVDGVDQVLSERFDLFALLNYLLISLSLYTECPLLPALLSFI